MSAIEIRDPIPRPSSRFNDPRFRALIYQAILVIAVVGLIAFAALNAAENLRRANIASGFGFLENTAGFAINQKLIDYEVTSSYGRAFMIGLLNTLVVAAIGIVLATFLGFTIGIARLSPNWIVSRLAAIYVEGVRNTPLLLQLFIWYNAVLKPLPNPRQGISMFDVAFLSNRGLVLPRPLPGTGFEWVWLALGFGAVATFLYRIYAKRVQDATGRRPPVFLVTLGLLIGLPLIVFLATGSPLTFDVPFLRGFNYTGGMPIYPEFFALLIGLTIYTAAFIAEIVRSGILAVNRGQTEAAYSLGLRPSPTLNLVVIPQAMRVIIPPLTSQYLNLTKNSSLAVAIGYPDLVQIFAGTVLNQTGQAIEVIAITMAVYLTISLATSGVMNWYNSRVALVER